MSTIQRLCITILLLLLHSTSVVSQFEISVPSLEVAIGQKFPVSWTVNTEEFSEPQDFDICLNNADATVFIPIASVSRNNATAGTVNITLDDTIFPTTYTLGIRFPGCSFLLAQEFDDFVVVSPLCDINSRALTS